MKKVLTFLAALGFLSTSTLSLVACGVGDGPVVDALKNAPKQGKDGQDPLDPNLYIYNDDYLYDDFQTNRTMGMGAQIAFFKIRDDKGTTLNNPTWKDLYSSHEWSDGFFSDIGLDNTNKPAGEHDFSFSAKNAQALFFNKVKDNDASVDQNKKRAYWFITSEKAWSSANPSDFIPTKENIEVPGLSEFNDETKQKTITGWIHLYLLMSKDSKTNFRIDFSAEINFTFQKLTDKNGLSIVTLSSDTWNSPFGDVSGGEHPTQAYTRIANLSIIEQPK